MRGWALRRLLYNSPCACRQHCRMCWIAPCRGNNADGQLGSSGITMSSQPVLVAGEQKFAAITAGSLHTCGISTDYGSPMYCWGSDSNGQLGLGGSDNPTSSNVPRPVVGRNEFVGVSAGGAHTCAIDKVASAWCW